MATLDNCDRDQLREAVGMCTNYLDEWSNNTVGDILRYMDTVDAQLANAANDEEARRIVAAAFPSPSEMAGTVSSVKGSVGLVGVGIEDILNAVQ